MQKSFYGLSGVNLVMALNSTTRIIVFKPHTEFSGDFVENIVETHTCQKKYTGNAKQRETKARTPGGAGRTKALQSVVKEFPRVTHPRSGNTTFASARLCEF